MLILRRVAALLCALSLLSAVPSFSEEPESTATPVPVRIAGGNEEPPDVILDMIEIARAEWEALGGKTLPRSNKYTQWVNDAEWGWCAGFTSWCAMKAGVPQESLSRVLEKPEGESDAVFSCSAVSPGKLLRAFQHMHRTTMVPRKGFFVIYGDRSNFTVHIGLVCDVKALENGKYRLTTIEGNMANAVRMYIADYEPVDVYFEQDHCPETSNLSEVPEAERDGAGTDVRSYRLRVSNTDGSDWYVTCFLMTWLPGNGMIVTEEETP